MKLDIILAVIAVIATLGTILVACKAFGVVTISWGLAVTPIITTAVGLIITITLVIFNYIKEN